MRSLPLSLSLLYCRSLLFSLSSFPLQRANPSHNLLSTFSNRSVIPPFLSSRRSAYLPPPSERVVVFMGSEMSSSAMQSDPGAPRTKVEKTEEEWRAVLTPEEYEVIRKKGRFVHPLSSWIWVWSPQAQSGLALANTINSIPRATRDTSPVAPAWPLSTPLRPSLAVDVDGTEQIEMYVCWVCINLS